MSGQIKVRLRYKDGHRRTIKIAQVTNNLTVAGHMIATVDEAWRYWHDFELVQYILSENKPPIPVYREVETRKIRQQRFAEILGGVF